MSLNLRSIAVAGIGFGAIAVASQGLITPAANQWDTAQGAAKSWLKFHPAVQHAEARFTEQKLWYEVAKVQPFATASPVVAGETSYAQFSYPYAFKANGYALASGSRGLLSTCKVVPFADCQAVAEQGASFGRVYKVKPQADATSVSALQQAQSEVGTAFPYGVRNPTDEELIVLVQAVRRARGNKLTRKQEHGIRRV